MRVADQYRFEVDAVYSSGGDLYITLECKRCPWIVEVEVPAIVADLIDRFDQHAEVCR